jgi:hypothetical protein
MDIWWTPDLPLIYVGNPKAGCSTIKQSLKAAQADLFARANRPFRREESPHSDDECLRRKGLAPADCRGRYLFTCVRNPFVRALSAYLDKVEGQDWSKFSELQSMRDVSFEAFLRAIDQYPPSRLDDHFRPQHINLNSANVAYDAVFFLENANAIGSYLAEIVPGFRLDRFSPHARGAAEKMGSYYSPSTIELVRQIYAKDFEAFGYSRDVENALRSPGAMIADGRLIPNRPQHAVPIDPRQARRNGKTLENTLRCQWLIERRLI